MHIMKQTTRAKSAKLNKTGDYLLVFLLDRTGSMSSCREATISGFNEFLHQQQNEKAGRAFMTLVKFAADGHGPISETVYSGVSLAEIQPLGTDGNPYDPMGMTPLFDAVGAAINDTDRIAGNYEHILFIIQTDGYENSSHEYNQKAIFDMVQKRQAQGWDFIFMGADIDAYSIGAQLSIDPSHTMSYSSGMQTNSAFASLSVSASAYRRSGGESGGAVAPLTDFIKDDSAKFTPEKTAGVNPWIGTPSSPIPPGGVVPKFTPPTHGSPRKQSYTHTISKAARGNSFVNKRDGGRGNG